MNQGTEKHDKKDEEEEEATARSSGANGTLDATKQRPLRRRARSTRAWSTSSTRQQTAIR